MIKKRCLCCGIEKPIEDFKIEFGKVSNYCKKCRDNFKIGGIICLK